MYKMQENTRMNQCCVCMKPLNKYDIAEIECKNDVCKTCTEILKLLIKHEIECPTCWRHYGYFDGELFPSILKIAAKDNVECHVFIPIQLFFHTSKSHVIRDPIDDNISINLEWLNTWKYDLRFHTIFYFQSFGGPFGMLCL